MPERALEAPAAVADTHELALRKAAMGDLPALLRLINGHAAQGLMLQRSEFELAENLRDFTVVCVAGQAVGCCALHFYTPTMGEIRSLAVDPDFRGRGAGRLLVQALEEEARASGLRELFAFTYIPAFFAGLGFREIEREALPLKAWKDCLRCPKFQCCDEVAVVKPLDGPAGGHSQGGEGPAEPEGGCILPVIQRSR
jgi:amino-acid N-acetyltransferase